MMVNNEGTNTTKMRQHQAARKTARSSAFHPTENLKDAGVVDFQRSEALNLDDQAPGLASLLDGVDPEGPPARSDVDPQILIKLAFKCPVVASQVTFTRAAATDEVSPPRDILFFANREDIDFADTEVHVADQKVLWAAEEDDGEEFKVQLSGAKFQMCRSLQILVDSNQNDTPQTALRRVAITGYVVAAYAQLD